MGSDQWIVLHGAVVGTDGKGVLIAGKSGAGKPTLAISCLMYGMDFVADDYIILREVGPLAAMPLYSLVCLNLDMFEKLRPEMPQINILHDKKILDATAQRFVSYLPVRCMIAPVYGTKKSPEIIPVNSRSVLTRMVYSTISDKGINRNTDMVVKIAARLKDLPAFEFHQCEDFKKNAEFLRQLIIKEL